MNNINYTFVIKTTLQWQNALICHGELVVASMTGRQKHEPSCSTCTSDDDNDDDDTEASEQNSVSCLSGVSTSSSCLESLRFSLVLFLFFCRPCV